MLPVIRSMWILNKSLNTGFQTFGGEYSRVRVVYCFGVAFAGLYCPYIYTADAASLSPIRNYRKLSVLKHVAAEDLQHLGIVLDQWYGL